jgi:peptidyl-prolyl cis-trans isomerase C
MSCAIRTPEGLAPPTVVKVNGITIPRAAISREVQHHPAPSPIAAWTAAARALAVKELLTQEAQRTNVTATPLTDDAGRRETEHEAAIRALIERDVLTPEPDEDSCRRYYAQNQRRFRSPDIFEVSHILFAARADDTQAYDAARTKAEQALTVLRDNPGCFADLARMHSACLSGELGGNLGQITTGDTTPEFEEALLKLEPGTMSTEPVATRYGHHIIRLDKRHPGQDLPYELVADRIADYLRESVRRRATAQYIARLASDAQIEGIELAGREAVRVQ